jgi:hypothetical protein
MSSSCNLVLKPRRGESQAGFLKRWERMVKKLKLKEEIIEHSALTRRFDSKSVKARKKRERAERQRKSDERRREKKENRSAGKR